MTDIYINDISKNPAMDTNNQLYDYVATKFNYFSGGSGMGALYAIIAIVSIILIIFLLKLLSSNFKIFSAKPDDNHDYSSAYGLSSIFMKKDDDNDDDDDNY
jgi:uncharacterized membrane protein